jgi:hypothetical protein
MLKVVLNEANISKARDIIIHIALITDHSCYSSIHDRKYPRVANIFAASLKLNTGYIVSCLSLMLAWLMDAL